MTEESWTEKIVSALSPKRKKPVVQMIPPEEVTRPAHWKDCWRPYHSDHISETFLSQVYEDFRENRCDVKEVDGHTTFTLDKKDMWYYEEVGDEFLDRHRYAGFTVWDIECVEIGVKASPSSWKSNDDEVHEVLVIPIQQHGCVEFRWDGRPQSKPYCYRDSVEHRERGNSSKERSIRSIRYTLSA